MAEDPIKLFSSRAERYPEPDEADAAYGAARAALAAIPGLGGSITEVLSIVLAPAVARRRDEWFKELADALDQVEAKVEGFRVENLAGNEAFVSATVQATRAAAATHQQKKREYLRNALVNVALGKQKDELRQHIFLNAIEAFLPAHVQTLELIWRGSARKVPWDQQAIPMSQRNYGTAIGILNPELKGQPWLTAAILGDLRNRGFSNLVDPNASFPQGSLMTNLGIEFLNFVLSPEDPPQ